jgi:hypothetical protein
MQTLNQSPNLRAIFLNIFSLWRANKKDLFKIGFIIGLINLVANNIIPYLVTSDHGLASYGTLQIQVMDNKSLNLILISMLASLIMFYSWNVVLYRLVMVFYAKPGGIKEALLWVLKQLFRLVGLFLLGYIISLGVAMIILALPLLVLVLVQAQGAHEVLIFYLSEFVVITLSILIVTSSLIWLAMASIVLLTEKQSIWGSLKAGFKLFKARWCFALFVFLVVILGSWILTSVLSLMVIAITVWTHLGIMATQILMAPWLLVLNVFLLPTVAAAIVLLYQELRHHRSLAHQSEE